MVAQEIGDPRCALGMQPPGLDRILDAEFLGDGKDFTEAHAAQAHEPRVRKICVMVRNANGVLPMPLRSPW